MLFKRWKMIQPIEYSLTTRVTNTLVDYWNIVLILLVIYYCTVTIFSRGLHRIPGPFLRALSPIPRLLSVYKGFSYEDDSALHQRYGPIVRLGPNLLSVNSADELHTIYGVSTLFYKSRFYSLAEGYDETGLIPDPFVMTDKAMHSRLRRGAANAYSLNSMVQLEAYVDPVTERLIHKIQKEYATGKRIIDLSQLVQQYAMDAICALTYGKDLNHIEKGDYLGFFKTSLIINRYMGIFGQIPWVHRFLLGNSFIAPFIVGPESNEKIFQLAKEEIAADGLISEGRDESLDRPSTFLQRLLLNQRRSPTSINEREIMAHCFNNIAAGSDTTAISIRSILFNTLKHPRVHQLLRKEIREAFPTSELESKSVSFRRVSKLPYLGAVIMEGIRLHPSVGLMFARVVPEPGATICGQFLKPGVEVGINPWLLQRNSEVFPNPDEFYPDRWLPENTSKERLILMNKCWIPFGHGAHTCSGRWISWMIIHKLVATLVLLFDMDLVDGGKDYTFRNFWLTPQRGLYISLTSAPP
ncbi:unnamed protein product [Clonostachys solani]|uniref:Cytochrome P450 n=1 Tax=Clonostachys solani TaxID=160281 RepID=A0A9N9Z1Z4_9HYPO|nr:unnamed protein product [Clonostachys solani]